MAMRLFQGMPGGKHFLLMFGNVHCKVKIKKAHCQLCSYYLPGFFFSEYFEYNEHCKLSIFSFFSTVNQARTCAVWSKAMVERSIAPPRV